MQYCHVCKSQTMSGTPVVYIDRDRVCSTKPHRQGPQLQLITPTSTVIILDITDIFAIRNHCNSSQIQNVFLTNHFGLAGE